MNILSVVVGLIFLIGIVIGYARGFLKIAVSLVAYIAAIFLVMTFSPHVSKWLRESTPLVGIVQEKVNDMILPEGQGEEVLDQAENSREQQIALVEGGKIPTIFQNMLLANNNNEAYKVLGVSTFSEYIGAYIAKLVADILAFLILSLVAIIVVRIVLGVVGIIGKIPVLGGVNRLAGGALGAIMALLIVWILFAIITLLYNTSLGSECLQQISESSFLTMLYEKNILLNRVVKF